jgi:hypothetical protein
VSASASLLGVFLTWAAIGVTGAVVMGRRGYAPFSWLVLGAVLGPLVVPLAFARTRQTRQFPQVTDVGTWRGPVDVLVGVDGSAESITAAIVVALSSATASVGSPWPASSTTTPRSAATEDPPTAPPPSSSPRPRTRCAPTPVLIVGEPAAARSPR